jgi:ABC-type phosphate transport system substrate-binding protein
MDGLGSPLASHQVSSAMRTPSRIPRLLERITLVALLAVIVAAMAWSDAARGAQGVSYRVVVNSANPVTELSREEVSRLFLRKVVTWDGGAAVTPVDQGEESVVRRSFTHDVHRQDVGWVKAYWERLSFTGQGGAPTEVASDAVVLATVARTPGAIGYVSATASLPTDVKAVRVTQ